jgi:hypothetical protein
MEDADGAFFNVGQLSPFLPLNDFEDFCKTIAKGM